MPPYNVHGSSYSSSAFDPNVNLATNQNRMEQERQRKLETVERKQRELADTNMAEERIMYNAKQKNISSSQTPTPPPLPETLPPEHVVNNTSLSQSQLQSGAARLDLLVGGVTSNSGSTGYKNDPNEKSETKEINTPKRVSFNTSSKHTEEYVISTDSNDNVNDDKLYRLERAEEKGPNVRTD